MKRVHAWVCLALGLMLLAAKPALAERRFGGVDDRNGGYHEQRRERGGSDVRDERGPGSAQRRPLGTQPEYRDHDDRRYGSDRHPGRHYGQERRHDGGRYGDYRDRNDRGRYGDDRYGRDARRAADAVRRDERGRVLSSERDDDRGYRVRVLTPDGYVRERYVDPRDDDRDDRRQRR